MTDSPLFTLNAQLDPTWPYRRLWVHPMGASLNRMVYVDWESGIQENSSPNYTDTDIVGRGELYKSWISNPNRDVQLTLKFRVQGEGRQAIYDEVIYPARWFDKAKYPVYDPSTEQSYDPPPLILTIGRLLRVRCIVTSADITWMEPFEPISLLPHAADVPLTVQVVRRSNPDMGYREESIYTGTWR